ncbi:hypothetical protein GOV06_05070 [Candidatus Woesearchaeota archaeon]|nr:hypothetical protein [Candidatus Woesearchaeota archaeon]
MDTDKCEKCGGIVAKIGIMDSGNSKFQKYSCKACGHTMMKCVGVIE